MAKLVIIFNVVIAIILLLSSHCIASPPGNPHEKCSLQDSVCLTEQARIVLKPFVEGSTELGIEKMDKMAIDNLDIIKYGLIYKMKNIEVEGLKSAIIEKVSVDLDLKTVGVVFKTSLIITGDYTAEGMLLSLPVFGDGRFTIKMSDLNIEMLLFYDIRKNNYGNEIMNLTNNIFGYNIQGNVQYNYENALNNDKEKNKKLHSFLNGYWRIMVSKFSGFILDKIIDKVFTGAQHYLASQNLKDLVTF